ncbi:nucleoid-associated protein [Chryseobacterium sp. S0630]|uniref:nucleoid-associated protein n=1 Tax=Chryseobacterium sp. S0630 TaxID=2957803 RepID=UPI00209EBCA3|nr:nucleoid-associated protein [Chryseobacterium sp. S0630]MCP1302204.1 nucleoid-associated protein [Chryseobacterium sp. S0630]
MPDIKQKGHDIKIKNIVIHRIDKEPAKEVTEMKLATKTLEVSKKEIFFIADIKKSFSGPGKTYGIFEEQDQSTVFENLLTGYAEGIIDFLEMTQELMHHYKRILELTNPASGGFLVFSDYLNTSLNAEYLLILAINNKQGYFFSEDLTLNEIESIDLSKIDVASSINISKWKEFKNGNDDIDTYLSFRSGLKNISKYFQTFIGCEDKTTKTAGSKKLVFAVKEYLNNNFEDKEERDRLLDRIKAHCIEYDRNNKGVFLSDISRIIDEENPDDFATFASDEKYSVNPIISVDKNVIKLLTKTKYKSRNEDFIIEFDNTLIGNKIKYDGETNSMSIEDIPQDLANQIKKHM